MCTTQSPELCPGIRTYESILLIATWRFQIYPWVTVNLSKVLRLWCVLSAPYAAYMYLPLGLLSDDVTRSLQHSAKIYGQTDRYFIHKNNLSKMPLFIRSHSNLVFFPSRCIHLSSSSFSHQCSGAQISTKICLVFLVLSSAKEISVRRFCPRKLQMNAIWGKKTRMMQMRLGKAQCLSLFLRWRNWKKKHSATLAHAVRSLLRVAHRDPRGGSARLLSRSLCGDPGVWMMIEMALKKGEKREVVDVRRENWLLFSHARTQHGHAELSLFVVVASVAWIMTAFPLMATTTFYWMQHLSHGCEEGGGGRNLRLFSALQHFQPRCLLYYVRSPAPISPRSTLLLQVLMYGARV